MLLVEMFNECNPSGLEIYTLHYNNNNNPGMWPGSAVGMKAPFK